MPRGDLAGHYPILSTHWPDFLPTEDELPPCVRDLRFCSDVENLHRLDPLVLDEHLHNRALACPVARRRR